MFKVKPGFIGKPGLKVLESRSLFLSRKRHGVFQSESEKILPVIPDFRPLFRPLNL